MLENQQSLLQDFGGEVFLRGVHDSRKKNDRMSVTMISRSDKVIRINRDPVTLEVSY